MEPAVYKGILSRLQTSYRLSRPYMRRRVMIRRSRP